MQDETEKVLREQRTRLKNRIHANLAKYGLKTGETTDLFGVRGRRVLAGCLVELPSETRYATQSLIEELDHLQARIKALERIKTLPGVAFILGVVVLTEVGDVERFPSASHLASYTGMTPRVHASGGHVRYGRTRLDVNTT